MQEGDDREPGRGERLAMVCFAVFLFSAGAFVIGLIIASFLYLEFPYNVLGALAVLAYFAFTRYVLVEPVVESLVRIGVIGLLIALFLPIVRSIREANQHPEKGREQEPAEKGSIERAPGVATIAVRELSPIESCMRQ